MSEYTYIKSTPHREKPKFYEGTKKELFKMAYNRYAESMVDDFELNGVPLDENSDVEDLVAYIEEDSRCYEIFTEEEAIELCKEECYVPRGWDSLEIEYVEGDFEIKITEKGVIAKHVNAGYDCESLSCSTIEEAIEEAQEIYEEYCK